jgi:hypothetical protein
MTEPTLADMPDAVADLATALSVALRVEPELVRAVRLEILPTADVGAEADLWFGPWVQVRETGAVVFDDGVRRDLQARLADKLRIAAPGSPWHRLGDVVERVHVNTSPLFCSKNASPGSQSRPATPPRRKSKRSCESRCAPSSRKGGCRSGNGSAAPGTGCPMSPAGRSSPNCWPS